MRTEDFFKSSFIDTERPILLFLSKPLFVIKSQYYAWRLPTFIFTSNFNVPEEYVVGIVIDGSENCPLNFMIPTGDAVPDNSGIEMLFDQENV